MIDCVRDYIKIAAGFAVETLKKGILLVKNRLPAGEKSMRNALHVQPNRSVRLCELIARTRGLLKASGIHKRARAHTPIKFIDFEK